VAPNGKLVDGVVPATLTRYIDINEAAELQKFGLHNGEPNDRNNLSEKWEGMALVPALDPANPNDYFLFVTNDNDFITQNGWQAVQGCERARGRHHDPGLPHHVAGTAEIRPCDERRARAARRPAAAPTQSPSSASAQLNIALHTGGCGTTSRP